jgi:hypothetical protein
MSLTSLWIAAVPRSKKEPAGVNRRVFSYTVILGELVAQLLCRLAADEFDH